MAFSKTFLISWEKADLLTHKYKMYRVIFPPVTIRSIYYHLKKGCGLGKFKIEKKEKGNFSWGSEAEKIYYSLGPNVNAVGDERVRKFLRKI